MPEPPVTLCRYPLGAWGTSELWLRGEVVLAHELAPPAADESGSPQGGASAPTRTIPENRSRVGNGFALKLQRRIHTQLSGRATSFTDVPLDLSWCTPFQAALARALRAVPWGEIVSYGELAARAGRPRAARAAGTFCAQNRFWLFLPCHRVVAADGLGGYGAAGLEIKRRLLALEHVAL